MRWWLVLLSVLGAAGTAQADTPLSRVSLTGLPGVHVHVEDFGEDAKRAGFDQKTFQTDVEEKLRTAGIEVLTQEEMSRTPGRPHLYVAVRTTHKQQGEVGAYRIDVELFQTATLTRNHALTTVITWSSNDLVGSADLPHIRDAVKDQVDLFINAWRPVNPK